MTKLEQQIIKEWEKVSLQHPSLQEVADKVGCTKSYVHQTIKVYKAQNSAFGLKKG